MGEISDIYPEKDITIVHSHTKVFNKQSPLPDKYRADTEKRVRTFKNCRLILGERLVLDEEVKKTLFSQQSYFQCMCKILTFSMRWEHFSHLLAIFSIQNL